MVKGKHVAHHAQHWEGSQIQSLLFDKQWTPAEAKRWAAEHGYRSGKVHVTDQYIRLRQFDPIEGTEKRTIELGQGIKAILEQVTEPEELIQTPAERRAIGKSKATLDREIAAELERGKIAPWPGYTDPPERHVPNVSSRMMTRKFWKD